MHRIEEYNFLSITPLMKGASFTSFLQPIAWNMVVMRATRISQTEDTPDFPGGPLVKNLPVNAGNMASISGPGRAQMLQSN